MRKILLVPVVAVAALLTLTACSTGGAVAAEDKAPLLKKAYKACAAEDEWGAVTLGDEGHTIMVDTGSTEFAQDGQFTGMRCVLAELGTSQAIVSSVDSTTSLMGLQQADDGPVHYQWSYHPDNGLNMVITSKA